MTNIAFNNNTNGSKEKKDFSSTIYVIAGGISTAFAIYLCKFYNNSRWKIRVLIEIFGLLGYEIIILLDKQKRVQSVYAYGTGENKSALPQKHRTPRNDLPTYSMEEVGKHASR